VWGDWPRGGKGETDTSGETSNHPWQAALQQRKPWCQQNGETNGCEGRSKGRRGKGKNAIKQNDPQSRLERGALQKNRKKRKEKTARNVSHRRWERTPASWK